MAHVAAVCVCLAFLCLFELSDSRSLLPTYTDGGVGATKPIPVEEHIRQMGYSCESHDITTEDGYVLTYHRIPFRKMVRPFKGPPVIVQHGLCAASPVWTTTKDSLAFVLADAGYDVWLGNTRGNEYARKHVTLDPDKDKRTFFNFSWHEMGYYDLPASIDYILNVTGHDQLSYIGHSMGTTMYFVMGATRPEYMDKINAGLMLSPVAYLKNMKTPILNAMHDVQDLINIVRLLVGMYELMPYNELMYKLNHAICGNEKFEFICRDFLFLVVGFDEPELSRDQLAQYLEYLPGGTSFRTLLHFGQIINGDFKQFDYGFIKNLEIYHSPSPPSYNLQNVFAPTYLYVAPNDWIITPDTAMLTAREMPNLRGITLVQDPLFSHADFMWAVDGKAMVYNDLVDTLNQHNP